MSFHKIFLVLKFEFLTTIKRRSVLFVMFGLPLLSVILLTVINQLAASGGEEGSPGDAAAGILSGIITGSDEPPLPDGLVDQSGLLAELPPDFEPFLTLLPDRAAAESAYEAEQVRGYFIIPADYVETGEVEYFADELPFAHPQEQMLANILTNSLVDDPILAERVLSPANTETVDLSRPEEEQANSGDNYIRSLILGIGMAVLFYMTVIGSAGYLLQSLGKEKQNRVLEILLSSTRPLELLVGKMIGLGAIGLVQLIIWSLIVTLLLGRENSFLGNIQLPELEPAMWFSAISFFLVGYLVYGSLFAGLGAISPGVKESSQYTFFLMLPTFIPLWLNGILLTAPNQTPMIILSLFPLTSPIAMPMRMAATAVPFWQVALGLALGVVTAVGMLYIATRFFRSQTLLSGQAVNLRRILQAVRGSG
jgi:ABC-2 type transport system permease protein